MYLACTPDEEFLSTELRAYFATIMTPEVEAEVANGPDESETAAMDSRELTVWCSDPRLRVQACEVSAGKTCGTPSRLG